MGRIDAKSAEPFATVVVAGRIKQCRDHAAVVKQGARADQRIAFQLAGATVAVEFDKAAAARQQDQCGARTGRGPGQAVAEFHAVVAGQRDQFTAGFRPRRTGADQYTNCNEAKEPETNAPRPVHGH